MADAAADEVALAAAAPGGAVAVGEAVAPLSTRPNRDGGGARDRRRAARARGGPADRIESRPPARHGNANATGTSRPRATSPPPGEAHVAFQLGLLGAG